MLNAALRILSSLIQTVDAPSSHAIAAISRRELLQAFCATSKSLPTNSAGYSRDPHTEEVQQCVYCES